MTDDNITKTKDPDYVPFWSFHSTRFWIALILCFLVFAAVNMRTNIGMAMVCMVNTTVYNIDNPENTTLSKASSNPQCQKISSPDEVEDLGYHGTYLWTPAMQGILISSTNYGSLISIMFAGVIADTYGPRLACMCSLVMYTVVTYLSPTLADFNYYVFLAARSIMGLSEGIIWPCVAAIIVKWFPKTERSTVAAIYTSGVQIGSSLGSIISARLCLLSFLGGWPLIFYLYGIFGIIGLILWYLFATNKPEENKFISEKEVAYLHKTVGVIAQTEGRKRKLDVPWRRMFTSPVIWAILFTRFAFCWKIIIMQMLLPSYFRDVLNLDMNSNGLFSACPFVAQLVSKNACAIVTDYLRNSGRIGMTSSTKIMECVGIAGAVCCLISLALFVDCTTPILALVILIIFGLFIGGMVAGAYTASLCIAPDLSGTIESAAGFMATLAMILSATTAGLINQTGSIGEWRIIFLICTGIMTFAGIFFAIFGSAEVQPWSKFSNAHMFPPKIQPIEESEPKKVQENNV